MFKYRDQEPDALSKLPERYMPGYKLSFNSSPKVAENTIAAAVATHDADLTQRRNSASTTNPQMSIEGPPTLATLAEDPYTIDWFGPEDADNPQAWPFMLKLWVTSAISLLTFAVYMGASIYISAEPEMAEYFGVSLEAIVVGLTLFILGYGVRYSLFLNSAIFSCGNLY